MVRQCINQGIVEMYFKYKRYCFVIITSLLVSSPVIYGVNPASYSLGNQEHESSIEPVFKKYKTEILVGALAIVTGVAAILAYRLWLKNGVAGRSPSGQASQDGSRNQRNNFSGNGSSIISIAPQEKKEIAYFEYNRKSEQQKQLLRSKIATSQSAYNYDSLKAALANKIGNSGFSHNEIEKLADQFILEAVAGPLAHAGSMDLKIVMDQINQLQPLSAARRAEFNRYMLDNHDEHRRNGLTARGVIIGNAGLCQWD